MRIPGFNTVHIYDKGIIYTRKSIQTKNTYMKLSSLQFNFHNAENSSPYSIYNLQISRTCSGVDA